MLTLAGIGLAWSMTGLLAAQGEPTLSILGFDTMADPARWVLLAEQGFGVFIAVFWAAPLISLEYERRTNLLAWSQDVSPPRWLAGKLMLLVPVAVVLAVAVGFTGKAVADYYNQLDFQFSLDFLAAFEASPVIQAGYVLFGFALGLVLSALTRRTVLSMALTLGIYAVVRFGLTPLRLHYLPTLRDFRPFFGQGGEMRDDDIWVDAGYLATAGEKVDFPQACLGLPPGPPDAPKKCMAENGIAGTFHDYQPRSRVPMLQLIEFGIFAALAAVLFVVLWRVMRRA
ncbi:ABC transporter permease subunit [Amycolatopsis lurida]